MYVRSKKKSKWPGIYLINYDFCRERFCEEAFSYVNEINHLWFDISSKDGHIFLRRAAATCFLK